MESFAIIIEECKNGGFSAYVPDLPGCISVGETIEELEENIKEAISLYIEQLQMDGKSLPKPTTRTFTVAV